MDIDERIAIIMKKMEKLSEKNPEITCGEFPPKWDKPLPEERIVRYEKKNGIKLPADYRRFITTIAGGGTQPFYGLYNIITKNNWSDDYYVNKKFPFTVRKPLDIMAISSEEYDAIWDEDTGLDVNAGYIPLCTEGCGMDSILIVNTDDKDTYGTAWYYDLANDAGLFPLISPSTKKPMCFLDWLEYYADKTLELSDDDFFNYGELAGWVE